jgi:Prohead core protein serine protease
MIKILGTSELKKQQWTHKIMNTEKKLLVECITFEVEPSLLKESVDNPNKPFRVSGILQRKGKKNQNGRIYPDEILMREVEKYSNTFVKERRALGECDHPSDSVVNLKNVSHNIVELHWNGDDLVGTAEILTTPNGNILRELFRNGIKLGISSRGLGSLKKISENSAIVGDDFELVAFDFVSNPSTQGAFMAPNSQVSLAEGIVKNPISNRWERADDIVRNILSELA